MSSSPLPDRLRAKILSEFIGQEHLVGKGKIVKSLIESADESGFFPSLIFWGPPGTGKTTLARIIANHLERGFYEFSAVSASTKDITAVTDKYTTAGGQRRIEKSPIVFLDEIHRFNKAQQDKLLPHVERGDIVLIGATTENPSFEVIGALLSRTRVLTFEQHGERELKQFVKKAKKELEIDLDRKAEKFLIEASSGDARVLLNVLEIASQITDPESRKLVQDDKMKIKLGDVEEALQRRQYSFDKQGEEFYNVISAFIKSMRASQPDAALYYLARMIEAGQDPLYIARRMVVFASEDVGMGQPTALVVANEVFAACQVIGYPECAINLAHGVVYLSEAKKDRRAYDGLRAAQGDVSKYGNLPVPKLVRNAVTKLMENEGYGKDYKMYDGTSYLPEKIKGKKYYKNEE